MQTPRSPWHKVEEIACDIGNIFASSKSRTQQSQTQVHENNVETRKIHKKRDEKSRLLHRNWLSTKSGELNHFVVAPRPNHSHACLCLSHAVHPTHEDDKAHTHIFDNFIHSQRQHPALTMMATATIAKPIYFQSLCSVTLVDFCCHRLGYCRLLLLAFVVIFGVYFVGALLLFRYFSSTFICYFCSFSLSPLPIRYFALIFRLCSQRYTLKSQSGCGTRTHTHTHPLRVRQTESLHIPFFNCYHTPVQCPSSCPAHAINMANKVSPFFLILFHDVLLLNFFQNQFVSASCCPTVPRANSKIDENSYCYIAPDGMDVGVEMFSYSFGRR